MKKTESTSQTTISLILAIATLAILIGYLERKDISKLEAIEVIQRLFQSLLFSLIPYFYGRTKDFEMAYTSIVIAAYLGLFLTQYLALASAIIFCVVIYFKSQNGARTV